MVRKVETECLKYQVVEEEMEEDGVKRVTFYLFERFHSLPSLACIGGAANGLQVDEPGCAQKPYQS